MSRPSKNTARGFSMIELMVVTGLILVVSATAVMQMGSSNQDSKANQAMDFVTGQLRMARGMAISQRHYVQVAFSSTNKIQLNRVEVGGGLTPLLGPGTGIAWEGPAIYTVLAPSDTPMGFGNGAAIKFTNTITGAAVAGNVEFAPSGQLVDAATLTPVQGTVFLGITGKMSTARAITVMGSTGRVRQYHWTAPTWSE